ncbi:spermatogenesis-associated protein 22 [Microcaecilia unicolor]|uniref:Spermatogenesis-associated protein 22 n=1 Tax=Microcaecilia unicolor TaxID=1415580 RepID=A0A6P7WMZ6_9AMPH|nr:spermatogenesis-associated protein 22 [Microcaecilia unicolor]
MKRIFSENPICTTAGCVPVPLFNQKMRNRQTLTSFPESNEPSTSSINPFHENFDFSPMSEDLFGEMPTLSHQGKTMDNSRIKGEKQNASAGVWKGNDCLLPSRTDFMSDTEIVHGQISTLGNIWQQRSCEPCKTGKRGATASEKMYSSTARCPIISNSTAKVLQNHSSLYKLRHNLKQTKLNEKQFGDIPEKATIQLVPRMQAKIKGNDSSLRIIPAVIERMKHWSKYTCKVPLLFEVLATLDSAVTSGPYSAKTFLLRDGQDSVPCIFYEIDRDLPRLIRGRVHRCMGTYDRKKNQFKCVSVRPASVSEQKTFEEFVKVADAEIRQYVKTINEL